MQGPNSIWRYWRSATMLELVSRSFQPGWIQLMSLRVDAVRYLEKCNGHWSDEGALVDSPTTGQISDCAGIPRAVAIAAMNPLARLDIGFRTPVTELAR